MAKTQTVNKKQTVRKPAVQPQSNKRKVNWVLTLVMSVLFGQLGVDRFMLGHVGLGILKLFTLGGCGIWWVIDLVLIATKHQFKGIEWVE